MKKLLSLFCLCLLLEAPVRAEDHPIENLRPEGDLSGLLNAVDAPIRTITSVGDGAVGSLETVPTLKLAVPALRTIYLPADDELQDWLLVAGTAVNVAGQVQRPADYDSSTNAKVWVRKRTLAADLLGPFGTVESPGLTFDPQALTGNTIPSDGKARLAVKTADGRLYFAAPGTTRQTVALASDLADVLRVDPNADFVALPHGLIVPDELHANTEYVSVLVDENTGGDLLYLDGVTGQLSLDSAAYGTGLLRIGGHEIADSGGNLYLTNSFVDPQTLGGGVNLSHDGELYLDEAANGGGLLYIRGKPVSDGTNLYAGGYEVADGNTVYVQDDVEFVGGVNLNGGDGSFVHTTNSGGSIDTTYGGGSINTSEGGGGIETIGGGGSIRTGFMGGSIDTSFGGGSIITSPASAAYLTSFGNYNEGTICVIYDSTTNTWGEVITGGGSYHVLGYYNGTHWTVMAK